MKKFIFTMFRSITVIFLILTVSVHTSIAQQKTLSYEQAFRGSPNNLSRPLPTIRGWVDDEHYIEAKKDEKDGSVKLFSVDIRTGKAEPYTGTVSENSTSLSAGGSKDRRNYTLSPDKKWAAYTKTDNNLYLLNTETNAETALSSDGSETILNGYASWVYYEEILGRGSRYKSFWWSPDSKKICFMRFDESAVPVFPIYWSDGQHGKLENQRYPKAGDKNPNVRIGIIEVTSPKKVAWADFDPSYDQYFGTPVWTPRGQCWIQWMNRGQDTLIIYNVDLSSGKKNAIYQETQKTWIDLDEPERIAFLSDGAQFLLKSDKEGWESLTLYDGTGKRINPVVTGKTWGISIVQIDEKNRQLYFRARRENSARYDFYRVGLDGQGMTRLSLAITATTRSSFRPMPVTT